MTAMAGMCKVNMVKGCSRVSPDSILVIFCKGYSGGSRGTLICPISMVVVVTVRVILIIIAVAVVMFVQVQVQVPDGYG